MTRAPEHLVFEFELDAARGASPGLLDVTGRLRIFSGPAVVYRDEALPLAELALQLEAWSECVASQGGGFSYDSRASAIPGIVQFVSGHEGWRITSIQQELPSVTTHPLADLVHAARDFVARVDASIQEHHGVSLYALSVGV